MGMKMTVAGRKSGHGGYGFGDKTTFILARVAKGR